MKYTLITGASSGIGKGTAYAFAAKKKNLILVARRIQLLEEIKRDLISHYDIDVQIMSCDLSRIEAVYQFYDKCKCFDIEVWINNAGVGLQKNIVDHDKDEALNILRVNVEALTLLSLLYAKDHKNQTATLINVSSTAGYGITSRLPIYSSTKMYICAFTEALYWELKKLGLPMRAKVMAPASTATEFELIASGRALDLNTFKGNTSEEIGEYIYQLYESEYALGYIQEEDCSFVLSNPKIPHSFNKTSHPNLLKRD